MARRKTTGASFSLYYARGIGTLLYMEFTPRRYQASKLIAGVVRKGHPWIHRDALSSAIDAVPNGSLVRIVDGQNLFCANAIYEPHGSIALRILPGGDPLSLDSFRALLQTLCETKKENGEAFRLINGEGDLFPGLTCDIYGKVAVWQPYLAFWDPLLPLFAGEITKLLGTASHLLKPPTQRGGPTTLLTGEAVEEPVRFSEGGLTFLAFPFTGQKSGFYLDLRGVRTHLPKMTLGRSTLNLFANNGAFTLIARRHGATALLSVDSDPKARAQAALLMEANGYALPDEEWITGDVFDVLQKLAGEGRRFDLVIIDPPNMCTNKASLIPALKGWEKLLRLGGDLLTDTGALLAINCSSFMPKSACEAAVADLKLIARKNGGMPLDHTTRPAFPEGNYLKWWVYTK